MQRCAANGAVAAKRDGLLAQSIRAEAAAESPPYGMTMKKAVAKYKISPQIIQQKHMQKQQADDTKNNRILWAVPGRGTQRRNFCDIGDQQEKGNGGHRKRHAPREGSPLGQCGHAQQRPGGYKVFVGGHFDGAGYAVGAVGNCGLGHKNQLLIENWVETIGGETWFARGCVQQPQSVRADMESAPTAVKQLLLVGQKLWRRNVQILLTPPAPQTISAAWPGRGGCGS